MAVIILNINDSKFSINGVEYLKHFLSIVSNDNLKIVNVYDSKIILQENINYSEFTVNGSTYASAILLQSALLDILFNRDLAPIEARLESLEANQLSGVLYFELYSDMIAADPTGQPNYAYKVIGETGVDAVKNGDYTSEGVTYTQGNQTVNSGTFDDTDNVTPATQKSTGDKIKSGDYLAQVVTEGNTTEAPSSAAVYKYVSSQTTEIKEEESLRNVLLNGNFFDFPGDWNGSALITQATEGIILEHYTYNAKYLYNSLNYNYNVGSRFLLLYKYSIVTWIEGATEPFKFTLLNSNNINASNVISMPYTEGVDDYQGSAVLTINSSAIEDSIINIKIETANRYLQTNIKHLMVIPMDGYMSGFTDQQVLDEINLRGNENVYFENGGGAKYAELAKDSQATESYPDNYTTFEKINTDLTNNRFENLISQGNFLETQTVWGGYAVGNYTSKGIRIIETVVGDLYKTIQIGGNTSATYTKVKKDHRYIFYIDLEVNGTGFDTFDLKAFLNSATPALVNTKVYEINKRIFACLEIDVTVATYEEITTLQPFFNCSRFMLDGVQVPNFDIDILIKSFMLIDLGVEGDEYYDADFDYLGTAINRLGNFWFPNPNREFKNSNASIKSTYSEQSNIANVAKTAVKSDYAGSFYTPWEGKQWTAFGDSLVKFKMWQPHVDDALNMTYLDTASTAGLTVCANSEGNGFFLKSNTDLIPIGLDCLVLLMGANDQIAPYFGSTLPLGTIDDAPMTDAQLLNNEIPQSFYQGYQTVLLNLYKRDPYLKIFIATSHQYFVDYLPDEGQLPDFINTPFSEDKKNAMIEIAEKWGIPVIDCWAKSGISYWTKSLFLNDEGSVFIHHSNAGGKRFAEVVIGELKAHEPQTYTYYGTPEIFD